LAKKFPFNSRSVWKDICGRGHLLVNGRAVRASYKLKMNDVLSVYHPIDAEPDVDTNIRVIKEAAGVLAVYKPGNLPMHESGYYRRNTLAALVSAQCGAEWHPVHRLDRETSGVVVFAATPDLRRELSYDFEFRRVDKRYLAMMTGCTTWESMTVDRPLAFEPVEERPRVVVTADGDPATTVFKVLRRGPNATLVEAKPLTGRTSQIRAHAAWLGHALVGDKVYHPDPQVFEAYHQHGDTAQVQQMAGFVRHALHAHSIVLKHPESGQEFRAEADVPDDMAGLLAALLDGGSEQGADTGRDGHGESAPKRHP